MRVVLLSDVFAKNMGYLENILPKYLARYGADVHVVAMDLPPYYWIEGHRETYEGFADRLQAGAVEVLDGYTLHILSHTKASGYMRMVGLREKLTSLRPHVVQTTTVIGWNALAAALYKPVLGYKLFTGSHTTVSVFPLANKEAPWWDRERARCMVMRGLPGRLVSFFAEKCYAATSDCGDVAVRFFGVPQDGMCVSPLGVDTELFTPRTDAHRARSEFRRRLGFAPSEIVCIYTGRFSEDKNPLLLGKAIERLFADGEPFRGLFVGNGVQASAIRACVGCVTHPFVPVQELGRLFRASEIGVWPTQESTSMLDAAACGLPIVVNDKMVATERVEGNGVTYKLNDLEDLIRVLRGLRDPQIRGRLGAFGAEKIRCEFSWDAVARQRLRDYEAALNPGGLRAANEGEHPSVAGNAECDEAAKSDEAAVRSVAD